jgi:membrane protein DedA with SNARE-associated domain
MHLIDNILSLIEQYGYWIILLSVMLESAGVPLPGETILIAAGFLVQQGHLDLGDTILFGILGAVIGDQIGWPTSPCSSCRPGELALPSSSWRPCWCS